MTAYRFVHAADVHLDSPLRSLAMRNPELGALVGNASRQVFARIIDLCLDEQVQALMLSGDLYDGEQTSMKTARFLADQLRRLHTAGIKVFMIRGNHDALSKITRQLVLPDSVHLFEACGEAIAVDRDAKDRQVVVHGLSFAKPQAPESLLKKYRPPTEGAINIGLMHTSLDGSPGHDVYAPCSASDLASSGFRYWALGHIHKRSAIHGQGACSIVMPGIPQGRDVGESGPKSVTLVSVMDDGAITLDERIVSVAQFERIHVDASGISTWRELASGIEAALGDALGKSASEHLVARLSVSGITPLAWTIRRDADFLRTEAESRSAALGNVWIDKLEIDCRRPTTVMLGESADPVEELKKVIADDIIDSEGFQAEARDIVEKLLDQLPPECRRTLIPDDDGLAARVRQLSEEGSEEVLARLAATDDDGARR
jgi:DNA repair exonuclease SbcCD nuclease subunit